MIRTAVSAAALLRQTEWKQVGNAVDFVTRLPGQKVRDIPKQLTPIHLGRFNNGIDRCGRVYTPLGAHEQIILAGPQAGGRIDRSTAKMGLYERILSFFVIDCTYKR